MAITTINSYADTITSDTAPPGSDVPSRIGGPSLRRIYFQVTLASQVVGEDILIGVIKKGCTIVGGTHIASATLTGNAQTSIGLKGADESGFIDAAKTVSDNVAFLKAAAALSTTLVPFAITQALGFGYTPDKDVYLTLTTSVATVGTEVIRGYCDIIPPV